MTKLSKQLPDDYAVLLAEVKERVRSAQYEALKAVNKELVALYWDIGKLIAERQNREGWGKSVVERLANDLQNEFPGVKGFSNQNLWYMRQFYLEYHDNEKLQPLVGEISWSKNLIIMARSKDPLERDFYIRMTRKFGWSKNVLIHQIENQSYEKSLLGQTNFDKTLTPNQRAQAKLAVKDEYTANPQRLLRIHCRLSACNSTNARRRLSTDSYSKHRKGTFEPRWSVSSIRGHL